MGFVFRSIFWLSLALVVVPPQARLGGDEEVALRDVDLGVELHDAAYALWGLTVQAGSACETNPELCKATGDLADTAVKTAAHIASDTTARLAHAPTKPAKIRAAPHKKIQARIE